MYVCTCVRVFLFLTLVFLNLTIDEKSKYLNKVKSSKKQKLLISDFYDPKSLNYLIKLR